MLHSQSRLRPVDQDEDECRPYSLLERGHLVPPMSCRCSNAVVANSGGSVSLRGVAEDLVGLGGGAGLGVTALAAAIDRIHRANANSVRGGGTGPTAAGLGEALFWIAALDDFFVRTQQHGAYWRTRAADTRGQTVGGLIYARNALGHGLRIAGAMQTVFHAPTIVKTDDEITVRWARLPGRDYGAPNRGTLFSLQFLWAALEALPAVSGQQYERDAWYRDRVSGRPLTLELTRSC